MGRKITGKKKIAVKPAKSSNEMFFVIDTTKLDQYRDPIKFPNLRLFSFEKSEDLAKSSKFYNNSQTTENRFIIIQGKNFDSAFKKIEKKIKREKNEVIEKQIDINEKIMREQQNKYYQNVFTILNTKTGEPEHRRIQFLKGLKENIQETVFFELLDYGNDKDINKENKKRIEALTDEFQRTIFDPDFRADRKFVKELFAKK